MSLASDSDSRLPIPQHSLPLPSAISQQAIPSSREPSGTTPEQSRSVPELNRGPTFRIIELADLDLEDLGFLQKAAESELGGVSPASVANSIQEQRAQLWRLRGVDGRGILITQVLERDGNKELFIWLLAGDNVAQYLEFVFDRLRDFGRACGCKHMTGLATKQLARIYQKRLGFRQRAIQVVKEI